MKFVLNPDPYLVPAYRISPFTTDDMSRNLRLPESELVDDYLRERFPGRYLTYTTNGRAALNEALRHYRLLKDDVVTILTTSGNFYISGCVTREIEKFCNWSRSIETNTRVILVNHEFGYPFPDLARVKKYGIPVIEDLAHSFFSEDKDKTIGTIGDFLVFSFPKMFPVQIGGLLVSAEASRTPGSSVLKTTELSYMKRVLSYHLRHKDNIISTRLANHNALVEKFQHLGFIPRFLMEDGTVPGVFMFTSTDTLVDLPALKDHCTRHGIQCSVFYGEQSFFLPVHQALKKDDLDYFSEVVDLFLISN